MRARVEYPFSVLKVIFGFRKVRCRDLARKAEPLNATYALVNRFMLRRSLLCLTIRTRRCRWRNRPT